MWAGMWGIVGLWESSFLQVCTGSSVQESTCLARLQVQPVGLWDLPGFLHVCTGSSVQESTCLAQSLLRFGYYGTLSVLLLVVHFAAASQSYLVLVPVFLGAGNPGGWILLVDGLFFLVAGHLSPSITVPTPTGFFSQPLLILILPAIGHPLVYL